MPIWVHSSPVHSSPGLFQWPSCEPRSVSKTDGKQNFNSITEFWRCDLMFESSRGQHNCIPHCISISSIILLLLMFCVFKDNINKEYNIYSSYSGHLCVMVRQKFYSSSNPHLHNLPQIFQLALLHNFFKAAPFSITFPHLLKFPLISLDPALLV